MPLLSSRKRTRNRVLNAAAWLTLAGLLALVLGTLSARAADTERCQGNDSAGTVKTGLSELGLFLVGEKQFELPFDEFRTTQTRKITIGAYANRTPPTNLTAAIDEGLISGEGHSIDGFTAKAQVVRLGSGGAPSTIRVCVEADPNRISDLRPGRYRGAVVVRANNYQDAAIPIVATFRADRSDGLKMAAAGVVLGLLVKMLTELGSGRRARNRRARDVARKYVLQWSFPLAIILGVVAGWLGFVQMYESNATWGVGGGTDSIKLFGTCFGFQMGSIGGADMTKRLMG